MDTELKTRWVAALRGGDYKQGVNFLRNGDNFCCLGVLCDIIDPTGWAEHNETIYRWEKDNVWSTKCIHDLKEIKLFPYSKQINLQNMNDIDGKNFSEIADWIEQNIK